MPPRHARQRATPEAAARNRAAAEQQRAARPARQPRTPARPRTIREERQVAVRQGRQQAVRRIARSTVVTPEGAAAYAVGRAGRAGRSAGRARIPTGDRKYQGVILAEFVVAALIVAVAPLARGGGGAASTGGGQPVSPDIGQGITPNVSPDIGKGLGSGSGSGPSPYGPDDLKQLVAIGLVYFVLALLSSGNSGRLAAWLGGLILVALGLAQMGTGGLQATFSVFQPASQASGSSDAAGQGVQQTANPTDMFPTILPGGQIIPGAGTSQAV